MTDTGRTAVLLDIDGTLVDSNYLHVDAWVRAFRDVGEVVVSWRVHRRVGMDGERLLTELLGEDHPRAEEAKERHAHHYAARADDLVTLPGARELLAALDERGTRVVLATSAPPDELERLRSVLDVEDSIDVVTSAADAESAKPAPDVVAVALERSGADPGSTVMVGDAVWDMVAATRAGITPVGVLAGGIGAAELRDAGAVETWDAPAHLLEHLDDSIVARARR